MVAGKKRVPYPAAGNKQTWIGDFCFMHDLRDLYSEVQQNPIIENTVWMAIHKITIKRVFSLTLYKKCSM
ncbi:MAG: hypothetical protein A2Y52_05340 [Sulfuricurvum sp. RIFCSPLOWO2_02_43_6]|nr:MAG: hypothetical protein A2Y52_05340 [Sulfuricurvum sp. RIFCSPLOWO2_02_43_6]